MPSAAGHLVHLNVRQRLHKCGHRALRDVGRAAHAELGELIRAHDIQLLRFGDHCRMVESTGNHAHPVLEVERLGHLVAAVIPSLEAELAV